MPSSSVCRRPACCRRSPPRSRSPSASICSPRTGRRQPERSLPAPQPGSLPGPARLPGRPRGFRRRRRETVSRQRLALRRLRPCRRWRRIWTCRQRCRVQRRRRWKLIRCRAISTGRLTLDRPSWSRRSAMRHHRRQTKGLHDARKRLKVAPTAPRRSRNAAVERGAGMPVKPRSRSSCRLSGSLPNHRIRAARGTSAKKAR